MHRNNSVVNTCGMLCLFLFISCEETLPPRNDPTNLFTTSVRTLYVYNTPKENSLYIFIVVKNNYEETLEAKAAIEGILRIRWRQPAEYIQNYVYKKNVKLFVEDIYTGTNKYDRARGTLRLDPDDSLVLGYKWDFMTDDKTDLLLVFNYSLDKDCFVWRYIDLERKFREISEKQLFEITANVKIFTQTAVLFAQPLYVNQCFVNHDFGVWDPKLFPCKPINPNNPCSILPPR